MARQTIIFDFDGTIIDSVMPTYKILNIIAEDFGYKKFSMDMGLLKSKTVKQHLKDFKISPLKVPVMLKRWREELSKQIESLAPFDGVKEMLRKLKEAGFSLVILTSNSEENVRKFLSKNESELFDFIFSGSSLFGKHVLLKKILKKYDLAMKDTIYVGDETRDVDAAKKIGMKVVAVSWGFESKNLIEQSKPDFLVETPEELVTALQ